MKKSIGILAIGAALACSAPVLAQDLKAKWSKGLKFESEDKAFSVKVNGRMMNDWTFVSEDDDLVTGLALPVGGIQDGTNFRRARVELTGDIHKNVFYAAVYDFTGATPAFKDMYIGMKKLPVGKVQVGYFKEPMGLEELTSSKYISFLERSLNAFVPAHNSGIMITNTAMDERLQYAIGYFQATNGQGRAQANGNSNITARVTGTPYYEEDGKQMVHLGVSYSTRKPVGNTRTFTMKPEANLSPNFGTSGALATDDIQIMGLEAALVWQSLSVQAEYMQADVSALNPGGAEPTFSGWYAFVSYFVTGEHRPYKKSSGAFDRVAPKSHFMEKDDSGSGAFEVLARISSVDLEDDTVTGGEMDNITIGANWHLNPNTRVMVNYLMADRDKGGSADFLLVRFQIDF